MSDDDKERLHSCLIAIGLSILSAVIVLGGCGALVSILKGI